MRVLARNAGLGRAALHLYHRPIGLLRRSFVEGGPFEQWRTELGRREMIKAVDKLPPLIEKSIINNEKISFLSGRKYWYQTVFCFASLQMWLPFRVTPIIFDDGSLDAHIRSQISRVIPWVQFIDIAEIENSLDDLLPIRRFPRLRERRIEYMHLRKLTDIHVGSDGWTLVLDSDMLMFRKPDALIDWLRCPSAIYMQDVETMYGYPIDLMSELADGNLLPRVNAGLYSLNGASIDWDRVEFWCGRQLAEFGGNYLQEQALTALALGSLGARPLPKDEYLVLPSLQEGLRQEAILHHYVSHSKRSYYQFGWKEVNRRLIG